MMMTILMTITKGLEEEGIDLKLKCLIKRKKNMKEK